MLCATFLEIKNTKATNYKNHITRFTICHSLNPDFHREGITLCLLPPQKGIPLITRKRCVLLISDDIFQVYALVQQGLTCFLAKTNILESWNKNNILKDHVGTNAVGETFGPSMP